MAISDFSDIITAFSTIAMALIAGFCKMVFNIGEILIKTATFLILSNKHWNNRKLNFA